MGRLLFVLPAVGAGDAVRLDTVVDSDSAADIVPAGGGPAITGAVLHAGVDGTLPRVLGPADGTATLFLKPLDYRGVLTADSPVELTGVDLDAAPSASSSAVPAVPDGVTITDADNTYSGTGTYKVTNTPDGEDVFLAVGEAGDSFPRLVMLTDGSLFFGDGTADPLAAGTGLVTFQGGRLQLGIPSDATTAPTVAHDDTVTGFGAPTVKAALDYIATNYGAELAAHEARITALETP